MFRKYFFISILFLFCSANSLLAQNCTAAPADCPDNGHDAWGTADDSVSRLGNPVLPLEIRMENQLRTFASNVISRIAQKQGWTWTELLEYASSGERMPDGDALVPYPLRSPHWCQFTFQCIVSRDSLRAWNDWQAEFGQRRLHVNKDYASSIMADQDKYKANLDSATYYGQLKAKYMEDHMAEYQQALQNSNAAGIKAFEKGMASYDQRINAFTEKGSNRQQAQQAEKADGVMEKERRLMTLRFRDATVLVVQVGFNMENSGNTEGLIITSTNTKPGFTLSDSYYNKDANPFESVESWTRSNNLALVLIGPWNLKPDQWGKYLPAFRLDKKNTDALTPKRIKSDQVQVIDFKLSGNKSAIQHFLIDLSSDELNRLIVK